jgi:hypothetical protein
MTKSVLLTTHVEALPRQCLHVIVITLFVTAGMFGTVATSTSRGLHLIHFSEYFSLSTDEKLTDFTPHPNASDAPASPPLKQHTNASDVAESPTTTTTRTRQMRQLGEEWELTAQGGASTRADQSMYIFSFKSATD